MNQKAKTILLALLTPESMILGVAVYNFVMIWMAAKNNTLDSMIDPWYIPWSFTNEPTRLLLAACGLCFSLRWSYLVAIGLSGLTLFQGIPVYADLLQHGELFESLMGMWQYKLDFVRSLHAQYILASIIVVYAVACLSKNIFQRNLLRK